PAIPGRQLFLQRLAQRHAVAVARHPPGRRRSRPHPARGSVKTRLAGDIAALSRPGPAAGTEVQGGSRVIDPPREGHGGCRKRHPPYGRRRFRYSGRSAINSRMISNTTSATTAQANVTGKKRAWSASAG